MQRWFAIKGENCGLELPVPPRSREFSPLNSPSRHGWREHGFPVLKYFVGRWLFSLSKLNHRVKFVERDQCQGDKSMNGKHERTAYYTRALGVLSFTFLL